MAENKNTRVRANKIQQVKDASKEFEMEVENHPVKKLIRSLQPTPKEARFIWEYFRNGFNKAQAALKAYEIGDQKGRHKQIMKASDMGRNVLRKYGLDDPALLLEIQGTTKGDLLNTLTDGLKAYKTSASGQTSPDFGQRRLTALDLLDLMGAKNSQSSAPGGQKTQINIFDSGSTHNFNDEFRKFIQNQAARPTDQPIEGELDE